VDVRMLQRYEARPAPRRRRLEAVVRVAERRLDARIGGEGGEGEHLQQDERDAPPRRGARRAGLDPGGACLGGEATEGAEMARRERARFPRAEEHPDLAARAGGQPLHPRRRALGHPDVGGTEREVAAARDDRLGDVGERARFARGQHAAQPTTRARNSHGKFVCGAHRGDVATMTAALGSRTTASGFLAPDFRGPPASCSHLTLQSGRRSHLRYSDLDRYPTLVESGVGRETPDWKHLHT